jgi:hypothetical protein
MDGVADVLFAAVRTSTCPVRYCLTAVRTVLGIGWPPAGILATACRTGVNSAKSPARSGQHAKHISGVGELTCKCLVRPCCLCISQLMQGMINTIAMLSACKTASLHTAHCSHTDAYQAAQWYILACHQPVLASMSETVRPWIAPCNSTMQQHFGLQRTFKDEDIGLKGVALGGHLPAKHRPLQDLRHGPVVLLCSRSCQVI